MALCGVCAVVFVGYMYAVALSLRFIDNSIHYSSNVVAPHVSTSKVVHHSASMFSTPVKLSIPSINLDAVVASAGIASDGAMDIKKDPDKVAWYNLGPRPGNAGNAVIAGHYGWDNGHGSVFNDLHTLKPGDTVSVIDDKGMTSSFVVRKSQSYDPNADASTIFRSNDNKSHLNLITCEGTWSNSKQTYSQRRVVFTDKK
jgi:LPXTG-site transpeptidase (sortase) family protein